MLVCAAWGLLCLATEPAFADNDREFLEAARLDRESAAKLMLLRGVDPNLKDKEGMPVIVFAAREKSFNVVKLLVQDTRTMLDALNPQGESALMYAALHGELGIVRLLVEKGAAVNQPGWTALHYAASNGHAEVVRFLLDNHAYIDAASVGNITPLMLAARHSQITVAHLLVDEGADPTLKNDQGMSAADYWKRIKDPVEEAWMRQKAAEFTAKFGTVDKPVPAKVNE